VLLDAAVEDDPEVAQAAKATLARLPGRDVDANLLARLPRETGAKGQVLIELAGRRRIAGILPAMVRSAQDADAGVRAAAIEVIGALGGDKEAPELVKILRKTADPKDQAAIEKALTAVSSRGGAACARHLLPLAAVSEPALRIIALRALVCAGGPDALAAVKAAIDDKQESVQDEAVRTLSAWPGRWPDDAGAAEPLLALAKSDRKVLHQVLGLRGYLQYVQAAKTLKDADRLVKVKEILPLVKRPEDKKVVLAALAEMPQPGALEIVEPMLKDDAVRAEAELTLLKIAQAVAGSERELARAAAEKLKAQAKSNRVREQAGQLLQQMEQFEDYVTAWQVSGPYQGGEKGVFETPYPPESANADVQWKALPPGNAKQPWMMDLAAAIGGDGRAAYVRTWVQADKDLQAQLEFGTDDGNKVWLNAKLVHANGGGGAAVPGEHKVAVPLRKGWNALLMKVTQDAGPWEFCLRIRAADGGKLEGIKVQALPPTE